MRLAFFCSGFSVRHAGLQPWLTFLEVGKRLATRGHEILLVTDSSEDTSALPLRTRALPSLRGTHSTAVVQWLNEHKPDRVVASISPFSLATAGWHAHVGWERCWGYLPYALYNSGELRAAWRHLRPADRWSYGRNLLVPPSFWRRRLRQRFAGVICQSRRTAARLVKDRSTLAPSEGERAGVRGLHFSFYHLSSCPPFDICAIPPGVDLETWRIADPTAQLPSPVTFLFVGSTRAIRGFGVLLDALQKLPEHVKLRVLARGAGADEESQLQQELRRRGLAHRVTARGGWLSPGELRREIHAALAVVLPFVLVPSEVPVSVLEIISCGTPVIVTDIDGLPESVGEAGVVVPPADAGSLSRAMFSLATQPEIAERLRKACLRRREQFHNWDAVADGWAAALRL